VTWSYVNLREGPGTKYKVIRKLKKGTPLDILDEKRGWLQVYLDDGTEGWLSKSATSMKVKTPPPSPAPSPQSSAPPPPPPAPESSKPESPM
jgi:N-acetylmuramoyl-L-alanine amidase